MTARELLALIDRTAMIRVEAFEIEVTVLDARTRFGATDVLVKPVQGSGEKWVMLDRVALVGC
jgi:hypothetical protein